MGELEAGEEVLGGHGEEGGLVGADVVEVDGGDAEGDAGLEMIDEVGRVGDEEDGAVDVLGADVAGGAVEVGGRANVPVDVAAEGVEAPLGVGLVAGLFEGGGPG